MKKKLLRNDDRKQVRIFIVISTILLCVVTACAYIGWYIAENVTPEELLDINTQHNIYFFRSFFVASLFVTIYWSLAVTSGMLIAAGYLPDEPEVSR